MLDFLREAGAAAWLVGGAVRDLLLERESFDVDLVTSEDPSGLARRFADAVGGSFFFVSREFRVCRVAAIVPAGGEGHPANYDFAARRGGSIEADLGERDFTMDAMAVPLPGGGEVIDPFGGRRDIEAGRIREVRGGIFTEDPLRLLRAVRLEKATGLALAGSLEKLIHSRAGLAAKPAGERLFAELALLLTPPGGAVAVRRLDGLGLLEPLMPEVVRLKGVEQNDYHHLDVYEHTLANLEALERIILEPGGFFPGQAGPLAERLSRPVDGGTGWPLALCLASLLHDVAKPYCKFTDSDGQVRFFEHDRRGAGMADAIMARFRTSAAARRMVSFLVRKHMRFEGLLQQPVPSSRARLRFLRATEPFSPEAIMLSVSDRLSVRGRLVTDDDVGRHLDLAREMMDACFAGAEEAPAPLLDGNALMAALDLKPGPVVGRLLKAVYEEQQLGNIASREEALAAAGRFLRSSGAGAGE